MEISDIFKEMANRFDAGQMEGFNAAVQFSLTGEESAEYTVDIQDGAINVEEGTASDPTATVTMTSDDFKALTSGELNPMMAFMQGLVKVDGDLNAVMKLQTILTG